MIVTTAGRTNEQLINEAKRVASDLGGRYIPRRKQGIDEVIATYKDDVLVVGKNRFQLFGKKGEAPFFFHPNSASFRVKRLLKGERDPFIETTMLKPGMSILDCTLGLASDSIVASYVVGPKGMVIGTEFSEIVSFLALKGLKMWSSDSKELEEAMRRIHVKQAHHLDYLRMCEDDAFDVVYFDPMFEQSILESDGIIGMKAFAHYEDLLDESIKEAYRVAKQRIVLKDHYQSTRFSRYGFTQCIRKTAKFHFGTIEISKNKVAF